MANDNTILLIGGESFCRALGERLNGSSSDVSLDTSAIADAAKRLEKKVPRAAFIDLRDAEPDLVLTFVRTAATLMPAERIRCCGEPADMALILKLVKAGVKDFLDWPVDPAILRKLLESPATGASGTHTPTGKLSVFYSAKGGSGVSLVTANVGVTMARTTPYHILACDLSPQCGDIATYLNLPHKFTVRDLVNNDSGIDMPLLESVVVRHSSGLSVLAAPRDDQAALNSDNIKSLRTLISLAKSSFDHILVDAGTLDPALLQLILSEADVIFITGNPDVVSIKGMLVFFNKLISMHYPPDKIQIIVNRANSKNQIDAKEFEKVSRHPIRFYLPNNYPVCIEAVNSGTPINDRSDLSKKIGEIASFIISQSSMAARPAVGGKTKGVFRCFL